MAIEINSRSMDDMDDMHDLEIRVDLRKYLACDDSVAGCGWVDVSPELRLGMCVRSSSESRPLQYIEVVADAIPFGAEFVASKTIDGRTTRIWFRGDGVEHREYRPKFTAHYRHKDESLRCRNVALK